MRSPIPTVYSLTVAAPPVTTNWAASPPHHHTPTLSDKAAYNFLTPGDKKIALTHPAA